MDFIEQIIRGVIGLCALIGICYFISNNKSSINWKTVGIGLALQIFLAFAMLKVGFVRSMFQFIVDFFVIMIESSDKSASFLFGDLTNMGGIEVVNADNKVSKIGFGFAFSVLPTIIFFSALSSILYYFGILQKVVFAFAWIMKRTMKLTGAESLAAAANVFIGQTEAPLVIKPYLERMSKSEMMTLMTGGMATVAGGVFGAYMAMLGGDSAADKALFGMHLLTASIISAPAAIVAAKIIFPETEKNEGEEKLEVPETEIGSNFLDALSTGITDGLKLAVNVGAMLLGYMAMVYLVNKLLIGIGEITSLNDIVDANFVQFDSFSLEFIFGILFSPIAWLIGISSNEIVAAGQMLGEKTILNEFVAYASLAGYQSEGVLSSRTVLIMTYALCGFANFASIGIQIGGISAIAPGQRKTITSLGIKALIGGTIAALMTAAIAGMII